MNTQIKEILEELYLIDGSLKNNETDLIRIIGKMIDSKPKTQLSESFKMELKNKIIRQLNVSRAKKPGVFDNFFRNFSLIASWAIMASFFIIILFPQLIGNKPSWGLSYNSNWVKSWTNFWISNINSWMKKESVSDNQTQELDEIIEWTWTDNNKIETWDNSWAQLINNSINNTGWTTRIRNIPKKSITNNKLVFVQIDKVSENAFWSIKVNSSTVWWSSVSSSLKSNWVSPVSPNLESDTYTQSTTTSNDSIAAPKMMDNSIIAWSEETNYIYSYTGTIPWLNTTTKMELLKKVKPTTSNTSLLTFIKNINLGWFNSQKIDNANLSNFSLKETKDYWLEYQINLEESKISIGKNIPKWSQTNYKDIEQTKNSRIKITDFPTDWELLAIAKEVISKYNIDLTNYWSPIVNNDWKADYLKSDDRDNYYLPDTIQVIYPLLLNGKNVYEDYGAIKGLKINYDVKTLNLAEVNWIEWMKFEASNYPIENNRANIDKLISKWWRNGYPQYQAENSTIKNVIIHLSVPRLVYININDYKDWTNVEYFVPAYIFESIEKPKAWEYFQEKVVIPLIKDFFNSTNQIMR